MLYCLITSLLWNDKMRVTQWQRNPGLTCCTTPLVSLALWFIISIPQYPGINCRIERWMVRHDHAMAALLSKSQMYCLRSATIFQYCSASGVALFHPHCVDPKKHCIHFRVSQSTLQVCSNLHYLTYESLSYMAHFEFSGCGTDLLDSRSWPFLTCILA